MSHPIIIVGAGAAGLMAAAELVAAGRRVVVLERGKEPGRKILASGGARCNLTHQADPEVFLAAFDRAAARFLKHAVYDLPPEALRAWFAERRVPTVVEADGCVFPASHSSKDVLAALLRAAGVHALSLLRREGGRPVPSRVEGRPREGGADLQLGVACQQVLVETGRVVGVETSAGRLSAAAVILATGGPAWPKAGGSAGGFDLLSALGHTIVAPRPGLAPLQVREPWLHGLQGVSLTDVEFTLERPASGKGGKKERFVTRGPLVFTHSGLSGPAALDLSSHLERDNTLVHLSLLPGTSAEEIESQLVAVAAKGAKLVRDAVGRSLPHRLMAHVLTAAGILADAKVSQLSRTARRKLAELLTAAPLAAGVIGGWDQAMVTVGGCDLGEVNSRTMESRKVAGLYVVGELLDVAGPTGGYNLHAAFATGRLAARAARA